VADRHVPRECPQLLLVEDLRDEPELAKGGDMPTLTAGDPGRSLAAVLKRVQPEVREPSDVAAGCVYAEDPAFIARAIAIGNVEARVGDV
jgi:hypothetical protein